MTAELEHGPYCPEHKVLGIWQGPYLVCPKDRREIREIWCLACDTEDQHSAKGDGQ